MTEVVLDASVIVKWALPDRARDAHAERALNLLQAIHAGRLSIVEPPHWLAEVAAVVTRLAPDRVADVVALMHAMEFPLLDELGGVPGPACTLLALPAILLATGRSGSHP